MDSVDSCENLAVALWANYLACLANSELASARPPRRLSNWTSGTCRRHVVCLLTDGDLLGDPPSSMICVVSMSCPATCTLICIAHREVEPASIFHIHDDLVYQGKHLLLTPRLHSQVSCPYRYFSTWCQSGLLPSTRST